MPDKKINELPTRTDAQLDDDAKLLAIGDGSTGQLYQMTVAQAKILFYPKTYKYTATGAEGSTITLNGLIGDGKDILFILRESGPIYKVSSSPDSSEFTWDETDVVLGAAVGGAGERFLIIYTNG